MEHSFRLSKWYLDCVSERGEVLIRVLGGAALGRLVKWR